MSGADLLAQQGHLPGSRSPVPNLMAWGFSGSTSKWVAGQLVGGGQVAAGGAESACPDLGDPGDGVGGGGIQVGGCQDPMSAWGPPWSPADRAWPG